MSDLIENCEKMTKKASKIAERLDDVDGDITELTEEELDAIRRMSLSVHGMFDHIDMEAVSEESAASEQADTSEQNTDSHSGRAFY